MIIVEQEKTYLVNFNNVGQITLAVNEEENEYAVIAQTIDKEEIVLGVYETEENAKEVLQEIKTRYACSEMLKIPSVAPTKAVSGLDLMTAFIYEMPKDKEEQ